jgi:hypothetical protein
MTLRYYFIPFIFLICLFPTWTHGQEQECACVKDAGYVVDRMKNDHPGFSRNLRKRKGEYQELRAYVLRSATDIGDSRTCVKLLQEYLVFFRDGSCRSPHLIVSSDSICPPAVFGLT